MTETDDSITVGVHFCLTVSTEENAQALFKGLFGMGLIREFEVGDDLCRSLFGMNGPDKIMVFDAGPVAVEVFVSPNSAGRANQFDHLCFKVQDREAFIRQAEAMGLVITQFEKNGKEIVFLKDRDGNLYEIK